ncbi:MAG: hypothetical protein KGJ41_16865 [Rhodospirillales bacterium]|nr:hypothetical protein [Rhodospirillales bacterium]
MTDFFDTADGCLRSGGWRRYHRLLRLADRLHELALVALGTRRRVRQRADAAAPQRILLAAVEVPERATALRGVIGQLRRTRHHVEVATAPMGSCGKFENINRAIAGRDLTGYDWLLVVDDDIEVAEGFVDRLVGEARHRGFKLAQPAHRYLSYGTFTVTQRHWATASRRTGFVEIGPVTLLHRDTFAELLPFPDLRWCWGLDVRWAAVAAARGWKMGVVDAAPIRHLRPVAASYDGAAARREAVAFLAAGPPAPPRREMLRTLDSYL